MLNELVNRLRGQIRIRAECVFPERVLNLCGARDLIFWDLEWESPTSFTCCLSRGHFAALRKAAESLDCTITVIGREGAPFFVGRFRNRTALMTGLVICGLGLFLGSFFIWDYEITGNETVPEERILRALQENGVELGAFGLSLDGENIRNHVLLDIPELSWVAVNVSGCRAKVQVRERVMAPERWDEQTPTNVVARRAGLVLEVRALNGVTCALPRTSVTKGQLLISGVEDTENFGARMITGMGTVQARTWYSLTTSMPLTVAEKQETGKEKWGISAVIGTHRIKFFSNSSIEGKEYDKIINKQPCSLLGIPLPVTLVIERYRFYETHTVQRTPEQAEQTAEAILTEYLHDLVDDYGIVKSTLCSSKQKGDALLVTLVAECEEEIGESIPIYTEIG